MAEDREPWEIGLKEEPKKTLAQKILAIQKQRSTIPKTGYNSHHRYNYSTEADVLTVRDLFSAQGLIVYPDVVAYEYFTRGDSVQVIQHIEYTIEDVDSGETLKVKVLGQGEDKGDKATYKGFTGANKYFFLKFVGCPTGDDDKADKSNDRQGRSKGNDNVRDFPQQPNASGSQEVQDILKKIHEHRKRVGLSVNDLYQKSQITLTPNSTMDDRRAVLNYLLNC